MITYYRANSIGKNSKFVNEYLEKNYKIDCTLEEGLKMVSTCLNNNIDHPKKNSEFCVISSDSIRFLEEAEINNLFENLDEEWLNSLNLNIFWL